MNSKRIQLHSEVSSALHNLRLDQALSKLFPDYSRAQCQLWIKQGAVCIDDKLATKQTIKVQAHQVITIDAPLLAKTTWLAQDLPLEIIYEDSSLLIINKPHDFIVHPGAGNPDKTLVNALLHYAPELNNVPRAGIVHRLDKDTTGLLIVARDLCAHHQLIKMMKDRLIQREYVAIVHGQVIAGGQVDAAIGRHPRIRTRMAVINTGKPAITHYRIKEKFGAHTYLQVTLETGRTHQIRVHLAHIHHPIVGDPVYGKTQTSQRHLSEALCYTLQHFKRQALHAYKLTFAHPTTQQPLEFTVEPPEDMQQLLTELRKNTDENH